MRVLVIGAGVSGSAAANLARRHGYTVTVYDRDPAPLTGLAADGFTVVEGDWSLDLLDAVDLVVVSPGVPEGAAPVRDTVEAGVDIWSEIEFASRHTDVPLVAVTGTNGKTTVTELCCEMLRRAGRKAVAAGNIGTALSDVADDPWDDIVVEASSFQLRFVSEFRPHVAVVLNVSADHLDWHGSIAAYRLAKARIVENQTSDDVVVYDYEDAVASEIAGGAFSRQIPVSGRRLPEGGSGVTGDVLHVGVADVDTKSLAVSDPAYLSDMVAAGTAAAELGATPEAIRGALEDFRPGPHRRQVVLEADDLTWIDDSKATNPHATLASLDAYPSVVLIAGGRNKGLELSEIVRHPHLRAIVAIGEATDELLVASGGRAHTAEHMTDAVRTARSLARPDDVVLLAPGCASFDMFEGYAARGDAFQAAVRKEVG